VRAVQGESEALPFYAATPRKLSGLIKEKQKLWLVLVLIAMGPYLWWIIPKESWTSPDFLLRYGLGIITVWLFARHICSLALLHHDPSTGSMKRPTKHVLSASFLGPLLGFSIGLGHLWTVVTLVLFHAGLVWAYQQKLRQYEPYILDPVMAPPVRADLQDGLIAAFYYAILLNAGFVFTLLLFIPQPHSMPVATLLPPLAVMFGLYRRYRKSADSDVPVWFGSIRAGDAVLMIMLLVGLNDVSRFSHQNMAHWEFWKKIYEVPLYLTNDYKASPVFWTIAGLGLLLANEFIFRGLIQSGMTARFGFLKAWLLSGVLAALCQPPETPMTFANNLAVALASGFLFQRTQVLWPGLLVAIIFNLSVLFG
jgi:membrane protease YdiL (CAAX protease family)